MLLLIPRRLELPLCRRCLNPVEDIEPSLEEVPVRLAVLQQYFLGRDGT